MEMKGGREEGRKNRDHCFVPKYLILYLLRCNAFRLFAALKYKMC